MSSRIRRSMMVLVLSLTMPLEASAQRETTIGPGTRLRVSGPSLARVTGTFRDTAGGMLRLDVRGDSVAEIPRDAVTNIDVSVGRRSRALPGAGLGLMIGAGIGAAIGLAGSYSDDDAVIDFGAGTWIAGGAIAFGLLGGLTGLVAGALSPADVWRPVPLADLTPAAQTTNGVFRIGVRVPL